MSNESRVGDVFVSLGAGLLLHAVFQFLAAVALDALSSDPYAGILVFVSFFATQLLYMLPAAYVVNRLGRRLRWTAPRRRSGGVGFDASPRRHPVNPRARWAAVRRARCVALRST